jgi:hypothetical protein
VIATALFLGTMIAVGPPIHVGAGVTCTPWSAPGAPRNTLPTPLSYLVSDLGKPGVPLLDKRSRADLRRIEHSHHSRTLRFSFLFLPGKQTEARREFIIFDADQGPCAAALYKVLNGRDNEYYNPSENPWNPMSMPGA